jgi:hypothetical protein
VRESDLLRQVRAYLPLCRGVVWWRANSGGGLRGGRPVLGNPEGCPDLLLVLPPAGRLAGVELKAKRGRLRPAQAAWRDAVTAAGGLYLVVRDLDGLRAGLRAAGYDAP